MAASLTSARARKGASATTANTSTGAHSPDLGGFEEPDDGVRGEKDKLLHTYSAQQQQQAYPPTSTAPSYSSRPFGSTTPAHSHSTSTSGWITSGAYSDKGKGKGKAAGSTGSNSSRNGGKDHAGRAGTGPLRDYGGGLGVVGQGEFKLLFAVTILACVVRLWKLDRPSSVVFDEVHFGGFATKYLNAKFFMDVHPPLAKLLITFAAWFAGFRGNFDFKDIGKEYGPDHVPYIAMRLLPASMGIALVPLGYLTLRSLGCRPATALLSALLLTFENGLITQSRLILLDSPLLFFTGLTIFFWTGFSAEDARRPGSSALGGPFSPTWWAWLALTGVALGATFSCKWVGLFTIATVGLATLEQLWSILGDTKVSMKTLGRHFVARALCLIVIPVTVYMFWFWVHFMVLSHSGDGDGFMSSEFQHTLIGHGMPNTYADVVMGSRITLKHLHTQGGYLHSHPHNYPGGSKQQQITLYPHRDDNNDWIVLNETQHFGKDPDPTRSSALEYVYDKAFIRLHHPSTGKKLHSHDLRPPVSEVDFQNEVSAYGFPDFDGDANDNFQIEIERAETDSRDRYAKKRLRALRTKFRLRHVLTGCYLFSHKVKLPEWGFEQQEVTCNKNPTRDNSIWYIETNTHPHMSEQAEKINYRRPGFFSKFVELQTVMWRTNAGLTDRHAYDSRPQHWPYLRRGINFWVKDHRQIYLIGNPVTWWISSLSVFLYAAARGLLIVRQKRGYMDLNNTTVQFYDRLCGFLFIGWALHYFPFFIMNRQLFLHHYFPSLYFSILLFGAVFDLATSALKPKFRVQIAAILLIVALWAYVHWSPLTYAGRWTKGDCEDAKWLKNWDFSCNDFHPHYSDYDTVAHPTPGKPAIQTGAGAAPNEAITSEAITEVIQPARNAFAAAEDEPAPAPKSAVHVPELFAQAQSAHAEAEKKEDAERQRKDGGDEPAAEVKETEPTNLPGPELPAEVAADVMKDRQEQEIEKQAQIPLEEAAPTPSSDTEEQAKAAAQGGDLAEDTEAKAGAHLERLAKIDDANVRAKQKQERLRKNDGAAVDDALRLPDDDEDEDGLARKERIVNRLKKVVDEDEADAKEKIDNLVAGITQDEAAVKPKVLRVTEEQVPLDPDERAAWEERQRHRAKVDDGDAQ